MPSRWTEDEVQFLRFNASTLSALEIAGQLGKTHRSVTQKATYEGLRCVLRSKDGVKKGWSKAEVSELVSLAESYTMSAAAKRLGRTRASVAQMAMLHKISFHDRRMTNQQVADILGVHRETVRRLRDTLGLKFRQNCNTNEAATRTRGATGNDIAAIAQHILDNPDHSSKANLRVTARHLRSVVEEWKGYE